MSSPWDEEAEDRQRFNDEADTAVRILKRGPGYEVRLHRSRARVVASQNLESLLLRVTLAGIEWSEDDGKTWTKVDEAFLGLRLTEESDHPTHQLPVPPFG